MDVVYLLLAQLLIVPLLIHNQCDVKIMIINYAQAESNIAAEYCNATSCGNLGNNIPYPFGTSSACALSSLFLLSNCSSPHPSWDAFTQTIPSTYIRQNIIGPPAVMSIYSANSSTYIDLSWDSDLISQPINNTSKSSTCSTPFPLSHLPSTIPPSIDLSTFADSNFRFSGNNIILLFNCSKASTATDIDQLLEALSFSQFLQTDTSSCRSYQQQCTHIAEYYTTTGHCVQLTIGDSNDRYASVILSLQQAMDALHCTHFQFFVKKSTDAIANDVAITETWSKGEIQIRWADGECWNCIDYSSSCIHHANHSFEACTCTNGLKVSDARDCLNVFHGCHTKFLFGMLPRCGPVFKVIVSVVPIVGTFLILLALYCCCLPIRRKRRADAKPIEMPTRFCRNNAWQQRRELSSGSDESLDDHLDLNGLAQRPREYSYNSIASATGSFSCMVGEGGFGVVFKGALDEQEIAVKVLEVRSKQSKKQFLNEVAIIGRIHHMNVVRLLGFCMQHEDHDRMLVYEYVVNGSLDTWLFSSNTKLAGHGAQTAAIKQLEWGQRYGIALGVARGLSYLHEECRHRIVHCDIKPQNILLDACMCPKIADFGLARLMSRDDSRVVTLAKGTPGYMAPEFWVGGDIQLSTKADVYSYGMVLLELVSGHRNFALGCRRFPAVAFEAAMCSDFESIIDVRLQAVMPVAEEERFVMQQQVRTAIFVALWCIQEQPRSRPSMSEVVQYLEGIAAVSEQPPRPAIATISSATSTPPIQPISSCQFQELTRIEGR